MTGDAVAVLAAVDVPVGKRKAQCRHRPEIAYADKVYVGHAAEEVAAENGIRLEVVQHTEAKRACMLLPRRWRVERRFACDSPSPQTRTRL
jgi:hypothetical protein